MKFFNKRYFNLLAALFTISVLFVGCSKVLDKTNLLSVEGTDIWDNQALATGYLDNIYDRSLPGWPIGVSANSDDASSDQNTLSIMYGNANSGSQNIYTRTYGIIRDVNTLLENVDKGILPDGIKQQFKAQAYFLRALNYWNLVNTYGGVPLILNVQSKADITALQLPRNTTSECVTQIMKDIDAAIQLLPAKYDDPKSNYGRITKGAALAYKGRILLFYASEQYDPAQSKNRWQAAYDANKAAYTQLVSDGKGLHANYAALWFDESDGNREAIIIRRYTLNKPTSRDAGDRPFVTGTNGEATDRPTMSLMETYPMKDGKSISDASGKYTYNGTAFWVNRDPRFAQTIAWNGASWPLNDPSPYRTSDLLWTFQGGVTNPAADQRISITGMYCRKAIDGTIPGGSAALNSPTDWIELRFAEVMLNLAECANETNKPQEAYDMIKEIRVRAGIEPGVDGRYGITTAMDKISMRSAVLLERRIELAFEGKRTSDLRRRRLYSTLNGKHRMGMYITKTAAFDNLDPATNDILSDRLVLEKRALAGQINLSDPAVYSTYFTVKIGGVEFQDNRADGTLGTYAINYLDKFYFFDIPDGDLKTNPKLTQTMGWTGGSFDPLQ